MKFIIATIAGGLLVAVLLFMVTAPVTGAITIPISNAAIESDVVWEYQHTDPWTGDFRPLTKTYTEIKSGTRLTKEYWPDANGIKPTVIPLPVGFVAGSLLTLAVIAVVRWPRRTPAHYAA